MIISRASIKNSNSRLVRSALYIYRTIRKPWRFLIKPVYRNEIITNLKYRGDQYQVSTYTLPNRYPKLFKQTAEILGEKEPLKILSFGCSYGDEVFSINEYFGNAEVTGVDINSYCINKAIIKNSNNKNRFCLFHEKDWRIEEHYDAIFAMAVFQHTKNRQPKRSFSAKLFEFEKFNKALEELIPLLKIHGLFIIDNYDFRMEDTSSYFKLEIHPKDLPIKRKRPTYNLENNKIADSTILHRIYLKTDS